MTTAKQPLTTSGLALLFYTGKSEVTLSANRKTTLVHLYEENVQTTPRGGLQAVSNLSRNETSFISLPGNGRFS